jgi:hypothetical protein
LLDLQSIDTLTTDLNSDQRDTEGTYRLTTPFAKGFSTTSPAISGITSSTFPNVNNYLTILQKPTAPDFAAIATQANNTFNGIQDQVKVVLGDGDQSKSIIQVHQIRPIANY